MRQLQYHLENDLWTPKLGEEKAVTVLSSTTYAPPFPRLEVRNPSQNCNRYYLRNWQSYELQILYVHSHDRSEQMPIKHFGKCSRGRGGTAENFQGTHI